MVASRGEYFQYMICTHFKMWISSQYFRIFKKSWDRSQIKGLVILHSIRVFTNASDPLDPPGFPRIPKICIILRHSSQGPIAEILICLKGRKPMHRCDFSQPVSQFARLPSCQSIPIHFVFIRKYSRSTVVTYSLHTYFFFMYF